jgi:ABC-2 type transport system permease protein
VLGTLVTWGVTVAVFAEAPPSRLFAASALWLAFGLLILAVSVFWSSAFSTLAALGASVATFVVLSLLTLWGPTAHYTPAGLVGAPSAALAGTQTEVMWPLATTVLAVALLVWAATRVFGRREI